MTTPSMATVMERAIRYFLAEVNTAIPAEVISYDPASQKCSVKPGIRRQYDDDTVVERAVIQDVPVVFPAGGGSLLSFPIKPGDTVLVVFSQRSIDKWVRGNGGDVVPGDSRKHAYSDAIAIPGLVPFANNLSPNADDAELKFGDASIRLVEDDQINISVGESSVVLDADGTVTITASTKVTVDTPLAEFTGNVTVAGNLGVTGDANIDSNVNVTGDIDAFGDVTANEVSTSGGIVLGTHKHPITSGSSAPGPTGEPV